MAVWLAIGIAGLKAGGWSDAMHAAGRSVALESVDSA
jgi:hypothetical protein